MSKESKLQFQAESLVQKIKHYLITTMGVTLDEATDEEIYRGFSLTLREEVMINWTATIHTMNKENPRILFTSRTGTNNNQFIFFHLFAC